MVAPVTLLRRPFRAAPDMQRFEHPNYVGFKADNVDFLRGTDNLSGRQLPLELINEERSTPGATTLPLLFLLGLSREMLDLLSFPFSEKRRANPLSSCS